MDRSRFLEQVRAARAGARDPGLPVELPRTPASGGGAADPQGFAAALAKTNGIARTIDRANLPEAVASVANELPPGRRAVVAADADPWRREIDEGLAAAGAEIVRPSRERWRVEAAGADLGITSAIAGVVATGSVLLANGPGSPRAASLLPAAHLVVLPASRLVPGLEDAIALLAGLMESSSSAVLVTGPSRTSDIEMATVYGVHGPTVVRVLVVADG